MFPINTPRSSRGFLRDANFLRFWAATVMSALGDSANFILVSWFVVDMTASGGALGTTLLCMSLPRLLFMLAGGVVADRIERKTIMVFSVLARTVVIGVFSLVLATADRALYQYAIYVMAIMFGIVDAFFWPARDSLVPRVVSKENLGAANSIIQTSQQLSMVFGPLLASLLMYLGNYPVKFLTVSAAFAGSTLLLSTLRIGTTAGEQTKPQVSAVHDLKQGIRYVIKIRPIALIMLASLFINFLIVGPLNIALPVLVKNLGWDGSSFGYLEGAVGVGAIAGGIITGAVNGFRGHLKWVAVYLAFMGLGIATVGFMHTLGFGLTGMLIAGLMMSMVNIPVITYIQTVSEPGMLGRVMSVLSMTSMGLGPVSYALTSFVLQQGITTPSSALQIGGFAMAVLGLCFLLLKEFREMEEHPAWKNIGIKQKTLFNKNY